MKIAINSGGPYVPGINTIIAGVVKAAQTLGWSIVGIQDGFEGLLFPDKYPTGGIIPLTEDMMFHINDSSASLLGTSHADPFRMNILTSWGQREETDCSDQLLQAIQQNGIDGVISIASGRTLNVMLKLQRKGLRTVCIPKSNQNDIASTGLSFGFNSALSFAIDLIGRIRTAAVTERQIAVVEIQGNYSGLLALQAGIAVLADVVLIPEIPFDMNEVSQFVSQENDKGRRACLVLIAEGAKAIEQENERISPETKHMLHSLSPGSDTATLPQHIIRRSGHNCKWLANQLQRRLTRKVFAFNLDKLIQGGEPTAVDKQLGKVYGAAAVFAFDQGKDGVMISYEPQEIKMILLIDAINKVRTIQPGSEFLEIAKMLGIYTGQKLRS